MLFTLYHSYVYAYFKKRRRGKFHKTYKFPCDRKTIKWVTKLAKKNRGNGKKVTTSGIFVHVCLFVCLLLLFFSGGVFHDHLGIELYFSDSFPVKVAHEQQTHFRSSLASLPSEGEKQRPEIRLRLQVTVKAMKTWRK